MCMQESPRNPCRVLVNCMPSRQMVRGCSAEQRLTARKARIAPLMHSLYDWIETQMKTASLGYGKSIRISAETVGGAKHVLQ